METQTYFKDVLFFVNIEKETNEKVELYYEYICKCFSYLLKQSDIYIITTIEKNNSLIPFFFSYLLKTHRSYDLYYDGFMENKFNILDKYVFEFYIKIVEIYLKKESKQTSIIKYTFLKINILMDVIMMLHSLNKKKIKTLLNKMYNINKFHFLNINKYISFLYQEILYIKGILNKYTTDKKNISNLLFQINEFTFCVYCFIKFFKSYYYFDSNENKLSEDFIIVRLFIYNVNCKKNENSTTSSIFKDENSFIHLFVQVYFQMVSTIYDNNLTDRCNQNILFLRCRFMKVLKMFIKHNLLHGDKKNSVLYLSNIIDLMKDKSDEVNIYFIRNDVYLNKWHFLEKCVLENLVDFEYYSYINNFLKIKRKREIKELIKKKYENEIKQIIEITNIKNIHAIIKILKRNNFNLSNCLEEIFRMTETEINSLQCVESENECSTASDCAEDNWIESDNICKTKDDHTQFYPIKENNDNIVKDNKKNILELLRDNTLKKNTYKKKNVKYKYVNDSLNKENKNKILSLLNCSNSSHEMSDNSLDNFENEHIFTNSYKNNYAYDSEDNNNDNENKSDFRKNHFPIKPNFSKIRESIATSKKYSTNKENRNNDNDKSKNYLKKTVNKGKYYRNQYDKKMSKGMF